MIKLDFVPFDTDTVTDTVTDPRSVTSSLTQLLCVFGNGIGNGIGIEQKMHKVENKNLMLA